MTEKTSPSWAERSGRKLTDAEFKNIHRAASELPDLLSATYAQLDNIYERTINQMQNWLRIL